MCSEDEETYSNSTSTELCDDDEPSNNVPDLPSDKTEATTHEQLSFNSTNNSHSSSSVLESTTEITNQNLVLDNRLSTIDVNQVTNEFFPPTDVCAAVLDNSHIQNESHNSQDKSLHDTEFHVQQQVKDSPLGEIFHNSANQVDCLQSFRSNDTSNLNENVITINRLNYEKKLELQKGYSDPKSSTENLKEVSEFNMIIPSSISENDPNRINTSKFIEITENNKYENVKEKIVEIFDKIHQEERINVHSNDHFINESHRISIIQENTSESSLNSSKVSENLSVQNAQVVIVNEVLHDGMKNDKSVSIDDSHSDLVHCETKEKFPLLSDDTNKEIRSAFCLAEVKLDSESLLKSPPTTNFDNSVETHNVYIDCLSTTDFKASDAVTMSNDFPKSASEGNCTLHISNELFECKSVLSSYKNKREILEEQKVDLINAACNVDKIQHDRNQSSSINQETKLQIKNHCLESNNSQQSPTTLSRSSSIGKRSLSSSSVSPRSPRISQSEDEASVFELCREAESIRQYIDSEFLSNLLLKGEREKVLKRQNASKNTSDGENNTSAEAIEFDSLLKKESACDQPKVNNGGHEPEHLKSFANEINHEIEICEDSRQPVHVLESKVMEKGDLSTTETRSLDASSKLDTSEYIKSDSSRFMTGNFPETIIKIEGTDFHEVTRPQVLPLSLTSKSKSDPNSPQNINTESEYIPVSNIFSLTINNLDRIQVTSPTISPSPSPTFSRSSFALNSQFLRSLSASTQELLNSLAISSSFEAENSPSPTKSVSESIKSSDVSEIELALPTLAPSTSMAICKLFNASEKKFDEEKKITPIDVKPVHLNYSTATNVEQPNLVTTDITYLCQMKLENNSKESSMKGNEIKLVKSDGNDNSSKEVIDNRDYSRDAIDSVFRPISPDVIDEDILLHEIALDNILDNEDSNELSNSKLSQYSLHSCINRDVPTLQELASASLPSEKPVSSAIISFPIYKQERINIEKTHLNRRFNSPEFRKTPSPRLSLRDKFERDLHSMPRQKYSKSLSKNARFKKGPNSRVNSQENKEKSVSKLDKSKSESRIGDSFNDNDSLIDERVKSEGSLECKRQTTVKFAPLNIEIPHYREIDLDDTVPEDDRLSEGEDIISPTDEVTAEMIRQRLWAGLRSFSVDVDILQAYGILNNITVSESCNTMNSFQENPSSEIDSEAPKGNEHQPRKTSMTAEDLEFLENRRKKRRGSTVALQELVKENTQIINRIVKQKRILEREPKKINSIESASSHTITSPGNQLDSEHSKTRTDNIKDTVYIKSLVIGETDLPICRKETERTDHKENIENTGISRNQREISDILVTRKLDNLKNNPIENSEKLLSETGSKNSNDRHGKVNDSPTKGVFNSIVSVLDDSSGAVMTHISKIGNSSSDIDNITLENSLNTKVKDIIVIDKEFAETDSGCFKLPLSAFCVASAKRSIVVTESKSEMGSSNHNTIVSQSGVLMPARNAIVSSLAENSSKVKISSANNAKSGNIGDNCTVFSVASSCDLSGGLSQMHEHSNDTLAKLNSPENSRNTSIPVTIHSDKSQDIFHAKNSSLISPDINYSKTTTSEDRATSRLSQSSNSSTVSYCSYGQESVPSASLLRSQTSSPTPKLKSRLSPVETYPRKLTSPLKDLLPLQGMVNPSRPITFNPFPTKSSSHRKKDVPLKLGLYSPLSK